MAVAKACIIKGNATKAVFIPHLHTVVAAGAFADNVLPDIKVRQQFFAGSVDRGNPQLWGCICRNGLRPVRFNHRDTQSTAL
ncbi:hypothetical protein D3C81_2035440 [compost metagenome]